MHRPAARATIVIRTPSQSDDGWTAGGATVVQIVTDDRPFLVDSVTMEVLRHGWSIREVFHPQFLVHRDLAGELHGIVTSRDAGHDPTVMAESWMHLEILPPARPDGSDSLVADLEQGLLEVLRLVEEAVEDWQRMITRAEETVARSDPADPGRGSRRRGGADPRTAQLAERQPLHLPRLPRVRPGPGPDGPAFEPVPATGLGILRADQDVPGPSGLCPRVTPTTS